MVQRKGGRFGIETNQTLKYNSYINKLVKGGGEVYEWRDCYFKYPCLQNDSIGVSVPYSLDRHKRWEMLESPQVKELLTKHEYDPSYASKSVAVKSRVGQNRKEKIEQFETKCENKHKHIRRQYEKEQRKLKIEQKIMEEKQQQEKESNPTADHFESKSKSHPKRSKRQDEDNWEDEFEEEEPNVVLHEDQSNVPICSRINNQCELGTLEVYVPNREKIWKTNQFRDREHYYSNKETQPRNQKKKEFRDSVFL
nr:unnamed protein product [Naegleria fowleri]